MSSTEYTPPALGVPVMAPVAALMLSPAGRPVALQVKLAPAWELVAVVPRGAMGVPDTADWGPGLATDTELVMVQAKVAEPVAPEVSVAVTVTDDEPPVLGLPVMVPLAALIDSPAGRPVADQLMVAAEVSVAKMARAVMALPDGPD